MAADITLGENKSSLTIKGPLNVDTVVRLRQRGAQLLNSLSEVIIDLQGVTACDSTALTLLTALTRDAKKLGKTTQFIHVPSQLMAIAKLSALDKVLALAS